MTGANPSRPNPLLAFNNVVSAAAGVIGLLYIVGVAVIAGRLLGNRLPGESVLSQLPQPYLLAVGLSEVVLPTILFPVVYLLLASTVHGSELFSLKRAPDTRSPKVLTWIGWPGLVTLCILIAAYLSAIPLRLTVNPISFGAGGASAFIGGIVLLAGFVIVALGAAFHSDGYRGLPRSTRRGATVGTVAAMAAVAFIVWVVNAIMTPLDYVTVCAKSMTQTGVLVATTSDAVYIGSYPSQARDAPGNLDGFSKGDVLVMVDGTDKNKVYGFVCPKATAVGDLARAIG